MNRQKLAKRLLWPAALTLALAGAVDGVSAPPRWIAIGPQGADTLVAAVDPAVSNRVYAATRDQVSVSLDGGVIFSKLGSFPIEKNDWRPLPNITDMAVLRRHGASTVPAPGDAGLVVQFYMATDIPSLYVSHDGGRSWEPGLEAGTGNPIKGNWKTLAAVPGSATVAFALGGFYSGNFRTDDGGATWRTVAPPPGSKLGTKVVPVTEDLVVSIRDVGLFRTTDGGQSWVGVSTGLPAPPYDSAAVAADSKVPTMLWLVIGGTGTLGTFRSLDAGATWTQQGVNAGWATANPTDLFVDGDTLFVVNNGLYTYRSRDGGRTWADLNASPYAGLGRVLARDAITGRLYLGDGSVERANLLASADDGDTVTPSERGLQGIEVSFLVADKAGRLYAWTGFPDERLRRRIAFDGGWSDISPAMYGCAGNDRPGSIVVADDDTLFAAGPGGILTSADGGFHWALTPVPMPVNGYCLLTVVPGNHDVLYSRYEHRYGFGAILTSTTVSRSVDGGSSWTAIAQPFTITDLLHATGGDRLIARSNRQLASSLDGGNSWSAPLSAVRDVSASAAHRQIVLVADDSGLYRTDDGGLTFARLASLPDASIAHVALDPNDDRLAYSVTDRGRVYRSSDGGTTWLSVGGQLDSLIHLYEVVATAAAPSTLVAGTSHGIHSFYVGDDQRELTEFYHPEFDHYFLSANPEEIELLREGGMPPWRPTGRWFWAWESGAAGSNPVCRFWSGQTFAPRSSHFYTPYAPECSYLQQQGVWQYEGDVFGLELPAGAPGQGTCGTATQPLYRAYNDGMSGAPNHRYTTDPAVLDTMIAQGWIMEGEATTRVFACVPAQ